MKTRKVDTNSLRRGMVISIPEHNLVLKITEIKNSPYSPSGLLITGVDQFGYDKRELSATGRILFDVIE